MFCINCGREGKEGELFCAGCGAPKGQQTVSQAPQSVPVQPVQNVNVAPVPQKKKMPTWLTVLLIIGVTLLLIVGGFVLLLGLLFANISNTYEETIYEQTDNYVYFNEVSVPTVYYLIDEYEMCYSPDYSYYDDSDHYTYYYCDSAFDEDVIDEYLNYLIEDYQFEYYNENSSSRSVMRREYDGTITIVEAYIYGEYIEYYSIEESMLKEDNDI